MASPVFDKFSFSGPAPVLELTLSSARGVAKLPRAYYCCAVSKWKRSGGDSRWAGGFVAPPQYFLSFVDDFFYQAKFLL